MEKAPGSCPFIRITSGAFFYLRLASQLLRHSDHLANHGTPDLPPTLPACSVVRF